MFRDHGYYWRKHTLANNFGGAKSTMGIRNFSLWRSQVRKGQKVGFNQFSIYIHSPTSLHLSTQWPKKPFLGRKKLLGWHLPHLVIPMTKRHLRLQFTVLVLFRIMHIMNCLCHSFCSQFLLQFLMLNALPRDSIISATFKKFELHVFWDN
jgi:hypothetical protein